MAHHFTKNTVEAKFWCNVCREATMHYVNDGRRGSCQECIKRLENLPKEEPQPVQLSLIERYGSVDIG